MPTVKSDMNGPLSTEELAELLQQIPQWSVQDGSLCKTFRFNDFAQALGFIVQLGLMAEKVNHHPEIRNVYHTVWLRLSTHDASNTITMRDIRLAAEIDRLSAA